MPTYMRIGGVRSEVTVGPHAGWIELLGFELGRRAPRPTPHTGGANFLFADGSVRLRARSERVSPFWILASVARGRRGTAQSGDFAAEVEFTRVHGGGAAFTDLRILMHGVRIKHYERTVLPGGTMPIETAVATYAKITPPGGSISSADITQQVRSRLEVYDWPGEYAQRFDGID